MTGSQATEHHGPAWVVLPTFNEAENVRDVVLRILATGAVRVLVVDDESPDGTGAIADAMAAEEPRLAVLHRTGERGLGRALAAGMRHAVAAGAAFVLTMDADLSHDPKDIPRLLDAAKDKDVALGSRYAPGGHIPNWSLHRKILSALANAFVRLLFALPPRDCTTGYRAYRADVLAKVPFDRLNSTGYSFEVEVLFWVARLGTRGIAEIPITFFDRARGASKMGLREALAGALNLLRVRMTLLR